MQRTSWGIGVVVLICMFASRAVAQPQEFFDEMRREAQRVDPIRAEVEAMLTAGDVSGALAKLQSAFPEATRTPIQAYLLGNITFEIDRKFSYSMRRVAAKAMPDNVQVMWDWAMEQHRAGEIEGALGAYQFVATQRNTWAMSYAMLADCYLRLNRIDEAAEAWKNSESAKDGTVMDMERVVWMVHHEPAPFAKRAELLARVKENRDVDAAQELIALDCEFRHDWWFNLPDIPFLRSDLDVVTKLFQLPADHELRRAMQCAADCATAPEKDAAAVKQILQANRMLIDPDRTIPANSGLLSVILRIAVDTKAIEDPALHQGIAPRLMARARDSKDARLWHAAKRASPYRLPADQIAIDRRAWLATGDPVFAAAALALKSQGGELKSDDADLVAAVKQFPGDAAVQRLAYEVAKREKKLTKALLASAAAAEFNHLSWFDVPPPGQSGSRSDYLREYFGELQKMAATNAGER